MAKTSTRLFNMTPAEFQTVALGWIGVLTAVSAAGVIAFFKIKALIDDNRKRLDKHDEIQGVDTKTPDPAMTVLPPQPQTPKTT